MKINEILMQYTKGEKTLEKANEELVAAGAGFYLNPERNNLTDDEIENGTAGLLDTGTGSFDKVQIKDGKVVGFNGGNMKAFVIISGKTYEIKGDVIVK